MILVTRRVVGVTLLVAAVLGGCTNYPAVGTLSTTMAKGVESWRLYSDDYADTCKRREAYRAAFGQTPGDCALAIAAEEGTDAAIAILTDYFSALSAVASDDNYDVTPGIDALASSARDDLKLDVGKAAAISGLAKFLAKFVTEGIREATVKDLISQADNASTVVDAITMVVNNYASNLDLEAQEFYSQYGPVAMGDGLILPSCSGVDVAGSALSADKNSPQQILYQEYYIERCNVILRRRAAVVAYSASAATVKSSLRELKSNKTRLNQKAAIAVLVRQAGELTKQTKAIKKAFVTEKTDV